MARAQGQRLLRLRGGLVAGVLSALLAACGGGNVSEDLRREPLGVNVTAAAPAPGPGPAPTYDKDDLYRFFAIAFGAAPGVTYMGQLLEAANAGMSVKAIVNVFTTKPQFLETYPATLSNQEYAQRLVNNVVGTSATPSAKAEAVADIVAALSLPGWTRGDITYAIFNNLSRKPADDATWAITAKKMANQVAYAKYFTEVMKVDTQDITYLRLPIINVTHDAPISADGTPILMASDFRSQYDEFGKVFNKSQFETASEYKFKVESLFLRKDRYLIKSDILTYNIFYGSYDAESGVMGISFATNCRSGDQGQACAPGGGIIMQTEYGPSIGKSSSTSHWIMMPANYKALDERLKSVKVSALIAKDILEDPSQVQLVIEFFFDSSQKTSSEYLNAIIPYEFYQIRSGSGWLYSYSYFGIRAIVTRLIFVKRNSGKPILDVEI